VLLSFTLLVGNNNLMFGTDRFVLRIVSQRAKKRKSENGRYFRRGGRGALLSGITRKVRKLMLLSGSRYFPGAATLGTLRYEDNYFITGLLSGFFTTP